MKTTILHKQNRVREAGFSLAELMIAITIGMLMLAGLAGVFSTTSKSRGEVDRANRQVENGRYAIQLLVDDLRVAGFFAQLDPSDLPTPAAKPDPCATDAADLRTAMPLHVQGYDDGESVPSCVNDVLAKTDILVVRRASTCVAGAADCDAVTNGYPYFQASSCYPTDAAKAGTELAGPINSRFRLDTDLDALKLHKKSCKDADYADKRRYITHIYFIANNNTGSDGIPTLKRAELANGKFNIVPLVEGIENMQVEYGVDTDLKGADNAGSPNAYTADPDTYNGCAGAACVENWRNVVAVKLHLLARNTEPTKGYKDTKTYTMGLDADGAERTVTPGGSYKRHVYQSSIRLANPAGRKEP